MLSADRQGHAGGDAAWSSISEMAERLLPSDEPNVQIHTTMSVDHAVAGLPSIAAPADCGLSGDPSGENTAAATSWTRSSAAAPLRTTCGGG
jgi:hypothetical protein